MNYSKRLAGLALMSMASFALQPVRADDAMTQSTPTKQQLMKDCIRKHQTDDVNLSKSQLNRLCKDELKQQKATGTPPPPAPPTDGPQTPQPPPP
jgi:hypothetical protein